jgi:uncharacterized protein YndB with AHSA1/START domain
VAPALFSASCTFATVVSFEPTPRSTHATTVGFSGSGNGARGQPRASGSSAPAINTQPATSPLFACVVVQRGGDVGMVHGASAASATGSGATVGTTPATATAVRAHARRARRSPNMSFSSARSHSFLTNPTKAITNRRNAIGDRAVARPVTSTDSPDLASVERFVPAPAAAIFDLLADPARHKEIDGSGTVQGASEGSQRLALGSKFGMSMKMGVPYSMVSTVVEFEENRRIAWQPRPSISFMRWFAGGRIWRYELEPQDGGTLVRETWDITQEAHPRAVRNMRSKVIDSMTKTLERIEQIVTATPSA